jgi:hypothetical protein
MDLVAQYPRLLENALLMASDFVSWQLTSYIGLACHTARQRVANTLVTLARTVGEEVPGDLRCGLLTKNWPTPQTSPYLLRAA